MSDDMQRAWSEVAERFTALGRTAKERYSSAGDVDTGTHDDPELRAAFDRLVAAGRDLTDRLTEVAQDGDVKAQARETATSLDSALITTVDLIADQVGSLFRRVRPGTSDDDTSG
jgi:DNA-binding ferritin-like protein